jgi:23S rRNA (uracil1939-C5)-methyltransferase
VRTLTTLHLGDFDRHGTTRASYRGQWIEVEHGIPGEIVRAEILPGRRVRARVVEVLEPSSDRTTPPCPYFVEWACGGCQWQQIVYEGQLARKRASVDAAMRRAGHEVSITRVHAPADPWRYRSTAGIALGKRAGFRRHGSLAIVPLRDCPISHPLIGRLCAALNDLIERGNIPDFRGRVRVDVRVVAGDRLQTCIRAMEGERLPDAPTLRPLEQALAALPLVGAVAVLSEDGIRSVSGELFAPTEVDGRPIWLSAISFFQTNLLLLPDLIGRMREEAEPLAGKRIADVYAGVGLFGLFLAEGAREVVEIEADPRANEAARITASRWDLSNVSFVTSSAEEALASAGRYDLVIVDPPRAGLAPAVTQALVERAPQLLLYVSCLPQSLARDLGPLTQAGYRVDHLELFDFYPQTYHVELLAVLRRSPEQ